MNNDVTKNGICGLLVAYGAIVIRSKMKETIVNKRRQNIVERVNRAISNEQDMKSGK